jgi:Family of unknown function (DUF6328)
MFGCQLVSGKAASAEEARRPAAPADEARRAASPADSPVSGAEAPTVTRCRRCAALTDHDSWNADMRHEMPLQRADRAYGEILQEVRVAQTGVQILFAFLLTLAFTARFKSITPLQRDIYVVALMLSAAATALLIAPAAFHRVIYRRRLKQHLVHAANKLALAGLVLLLLAMISALVLILDVTTGTGTAVILASAMLTWFFTWWFILPVHSRLRHSAGNGDRSQSPHGHAQPRDPPVPRHAPASGIRSKSARL